MAEASGSMGEYMAAIHWLIYCLFPSDRLFGVSMTFGIDKIENARERPKTIELTLVNMPLISCLQNLEDTTI
jgi:hypothetical protein